MRTVVCGRPPKRLVRQRKKHENYGVGNRKLNEKFPTESVASIFETHTGPRVTAQDRIDEASRSDCIGEAANQGERNKSVKRRVGY